MEGRGTRWGEGIANCEAYKLDSKFIFVYCKILQCFTNLFFTFYD